MTTVIGDISGVAVLTSLGYLVCRDCFRNPVTPPQYIRGIVGMSGKVVYAGDTYSDEPCDVCGKKVTK